MKKEEVSEIIEEHKVSLTECDELIFDTICTGGIEELCELLVGKDYVRNLAVGLTHLCFRNGPVETMHSGISLEKALENNDFSNLSQLSQQDMMTLNKFMVDRLGFFIHLLLEGRFVEASMFLYPYLRYGGHWDDPDISGQEEEWKRIIQLH